MEVTRKNFAEILPDVEAAIDASDFLCIDGEFSGLFSGNNINAFDSPSECYQKYRNGSKEFLLIQFGLSAFRWDSETESYKHSDFSFYLFPRSEIKFAPDKIFSCQSSSLEFLSKHKFDFNKLIYEGISYLDTIEEIKLRERLQEKQLSEKESKFSTQNSNSKNNSVNVPENFQPKLNDLYKRIKDFLKNDDEEHVVLENFNPFHRKLIYQELENKFGKKIHCETVVDAKDKIQIVVGRAISEDEKKKRLEFAHAKEWEDLESLVGFSIIARKISNCNKLVVGHCMILDILHTLHDFFHPLPEDYKEFKPLASNLFTSVLDTMYMIKSNTFKELFPSIDLSSMHTTVSKDPFKKPKIEEDERLKACSYSSDSNKFHSAGYDAFITGASLTSLYEYLKSFNPDGIKNISNDKLNAESLILKPYLNKLFLYKTSFQASPYINLSGEDANPSRDHVFHISFPKSWTKNDISELFEPFGGVSFIAFLDDTSAYASLKQHSQAVFVKSASFNAECTITPFRDYKTIDNYSITVNDERKTKLSSIFDQKTPLSPILEKRGQKRKISEGSSDNPFKTNNKIEEIPKVEKRNQKERKLSSSSSKDKNVKGNKGDAKVANVFSMSDSWD